MKKTIYDLRFIDNNGDVHVRQLSDNNEYVLKIFTDEDKNSHFVWLNNEGDAVETTEGINRGCFDVSFLNSIEISKREIDIC